LDELEGVLRDKYVGVGEDGLLKWPAYKQKLVFIFDNASIHTTTLIADYYS